MGDFSSEMFRDGCVRVRGCQCGLDCSSYPSLFLLCLLATRVYMRKGPSSYSNEVRTSHRSPHQAKCTYAPSLSLPLLPSLCRTRPMQQKTFCTGRSEIPFSSRELLFVLPVPFDLMTREHLLRTAGMVSSLANSHLELCRSVRV